ncbi:GNAT family N-acetyltransferase [Streptomyces sp. NPDC004111]|uniref:GNAT family N-acetyltransferase n=1 Tax=Streptomyces sp. NPDC004111 TaxID=3364690 RepID=UPI00368F6AF9
MSDHLAAVRLSGYDRTDQTRILGDAPDPFGVADTGLTWLPKEEHFGLVRPDGRLVAHAGLLRIPLSIGDRDTEAVGVGGVAVAPDVRGRGLARRVVGAALEHARTLGPERALLFCRPPLVPLYEKLGWRPVVGEVRVEQPQGPVIMPLRTMWHPLHDGTDWPGGAVRLRSYPM